jgi:hypothetical protein
MIIRLHNPFISVQRAENAKTEENPAPLSYPQRVKEDRKATILLFFLLAGAALMYVFLN